MSYQITTTNYHNKYTYWLPRLLAIIGIVFVSIFSFDVFDNNTGWELAIAFFMHLIPSFVMIISLAIAWKNDLYGAMIFSLLATISVIIFYTLDAYLGLLFITLPCFIVGMLFFYNMYKEEEEQFRYMFSRM